MENGTDSFIVLRLSGASETTPVFVGKMVGFLEGNRRLVLHDTELADTVINMNLRIPYGKCRHKPLIVIAAVGFINDAHVIGLNDAEILKRGASGNHVCLIAFGKLHGNAQRNQSKFSFLQGDFTCSP